MRKYTLSEIDRMEGHDFEYFCAELLKANGYEKAEVTPGSGDQGIDVIAEKDGIRYGIQCKCYSSDIGNKAVQEAFSGKEFYNCHVGAVLTNRYFTTAAVDLARKNRILLWGRNKLIGMMKEAGIFLKENEKADYDHQWQMDQERIDRERQESAYQFAEELGKEQQAEAEEAFEKKAEIETKIALEESRRDAIKKDYDRVSIIGGTTALGFIILVIVGWFYGERIADTVLAQIIMLLMIVLVIISAVLMAYSRSLMKDYDIAKRRVEELTKTEQSNYMETRQKYEGR